MSQKQNIQNKSYEDRFSDFEQRIMNGPSDEEMAELGNRDAEERIQASFNRFAESAESHKSPADRIGFEGRNRTHRVIGSAAIDIHVKHPRDKGVVIPVHTVGSDGINAVVDRTHEAYLNSRSGDSIQKAS